MKRLLSYDGPGIGFLNIIGEILIVNFVFLVCCIPIITIGPSVTGLYYAIVKSVRHGRGYPVKEFFSAFKRVLKKGCLGTLIMGIVLTALLYGRKAAVEGVVNIPKIPIEVYDLLLILSVSLLVYLFPVMSRYVMSLWEMVKLSLVMSIRYFYLTIVFVGLVGFVGWLFINNILPLILILVVPGVLCYGLSFLMEKPLLHYMPPVPEGMDDWYHEKK